MTLFIIKILYHIIYNECKQFFLCENLKNNIIYQTKFK